MVIQRIYKRNTRDYYSCRYIGGSACSTSDATGYNRGNITELIECSSAADVFGIKIVADGGIKNGNYAAKWIWCGCRLCNDGWLFR